MAVTVVGLKIVGLIMIVALADHPARGGAVLDGAQRDGGADRGRLRRGWRAIWGRRFRPRPPRCRRGRSSCWWRSGLFVVSLLFAPARGTVAAWIAGAAVSPAGAPAAGFAGHGARPAGARGLDPAASGGRGAGAAGWRADRGGAGAGGAGACGTSGGGRSRAVPPGCGRRRPLRWAEGHRDGADADQLSDIDRRLVAAGAVEVR